MQRSHHLSQRGSSVRKVWHITENMCCKSCGQGTWRFCCPVHARILKTHEPQNNQTHTSAEWQICPISPVSTSSLDLFSSLIGSLISYGPSALRTHLSDSYIWVCYNKVTTLFKHVSNKHMFVRLLSHGTTRRDHTEMVNDNRDSLLPLLLHVYYLFHSQIRHQTRK